MKKEEEEVAFICGIDRKLKNAPCDLRKKVNTPDSLTIKDLQRLKDDFGISNIEVRLILDI